MTDTTLFRSISKFNGRFQHTDEELRFISDTIEFLLNVEVQYSKGPDPHYYKEIVLDEVTEYKYECFPRIIKTLQRIGFDVSVCSYGENYGLTFVRIRTDADGYSLKPLF